MEALKFTAAVSSIGGDFSATAAFDDYFSFSGRKYRVIDTCIVSGKKGYQVEKHDVKQNMLLNVLKVISYLTIIIPLVMAVGKLIARSKNDFFVDKGQEEKDSSMKKPIVTKNPSEVISKKAAQACDNKKVMSPLESDVQARVQEIRKFKNKTLEVLRSAKVEQPQLNFSLTQEQQECLMQANNSRFNRNTPLGAKIIRGGDNFVLFLDSIPGFVFKPVDSKEEIETYIETVQKGRQTVAENNLYLLHVPESRIWEIKGQYFIMQERADLISGTYLDQKGIYLHCWNDEEMRDYMKTLFSQLIKFISKNGFSDVKYDNIPFTWNGKVALIDLDQLSTFKGLTEGRTGRKDGLFHYIPSKYLDDFLEIAKDQLEKDIYQELSQSIVDIKISAKKNENKHKDYAQFLQKNSISDPSQKINSDIQKIFKDKNKQKFAEHVLENINHDLSQSKNFDIQSGRSVIFNIHTNDPLGRKAKEIWKEAFPNFSENNLRSILLEVLEGLKNAGYIYKFKAPNNYNYAKVIC